MPCALLGLARGERSLRRRRRRRAGAAVLEQRPPLAPQRPARPTRTSTAPPTDPGASSRSAPSGTILSSRRRQTLGQAPAPAPSSTCTRSSGPASEYLAGGDIGRVLSSTDGKRWQRVDFPGFHSVRGFATDGGIVSPPAPARRPGWRRARANGSSSRSASRASRPAIAYGGGRFVIVGHNGEVLVSTDAGESWTQEPAGVEVNLDAVTWTGEPLPRHRRGDRDRLRRRRRLVAGLAADRAQRPRPGPLRRRRRRRRRRRHQGPPARRLDPARRVGARRDLAPVVGKPAPGDPLGRPSFDQRSQITDREQHAQGGADLQVGRGRLARRRSRPSAASAST